MFCVLIYCLVVNSVVIVSLLLRGLRGALLGGVVGFAVWFVCFCCGGGLVFVDCLWFWLECFIVGCRYVVDFFVLVW